jgi:hypothetical protein
LLWESISLPSSLFFKYSLEISISPHIYIQLHLAGSQNRRSFLTALALIAARHASYWRLDSIKNNSLLYLIYSLVVGGNFVLKPWPHVWFKFSQIFFSQKFDQDSHLIPWTCEDEMYLFVYSLPLHLSFFFLPSSAPTRRSLLAPKILPFLTYLFSSTTQHLQSSCPEKNPLKTKSSDTKSFAFG